MILHEYNHRDGLSLIREAITALEDEMGITNAYPYTQKLLRIYTDLRELEHKKKPGKIHRMFHGSKA
jgi:hypothetical protein